MTAVMRLLICFLCCTIPFAGIGQRTDWQQNLRYKIKVTLNDSAHTLNGHMELTYKNNSPDTLGYIWFHVWPNAFKNDKTAYSAHQLRTGNTAFYFSRPEDRGYINRLDFRAGITSLEVADHAVHTDIIRVILSQPLLPGHETTITTPFHVKLPRNFEGFGHDGIGGQSYLLSNWYPNAAVYDNKGWHEMPFLEQEMPFSGFADYDVELTLPRNYLVASNAQLQNQDEWQWLNTKTTAPQLPKIKPSAKKQSFKKQSLKSEAIPSDRITKTLHYTTHANQLVFFADKHFWLDTAVVQQASGNNLTVLLFHQLQNKPTKPLISIKSLVDAVQFNSTFLGDYPHPTISFSESVAYDMKSASAARTTVFHSSQKDMSSQVHRRLTHDWLLSGAAYREPFILKGLTEFINDHFRFRQSNSGLSYDTYLARDVQLNRTRTLQQAAYLKGESQPLSTAIESTSPGNIRLLPSMSADWLRMIESKTGVDNFKQALQDFFSTTRFEVVDRENLVAELASKTQADISSLQISPNVVLPSSDRSIKPQPTTWLKVPDTNGQLTADTLSAKLAIAPFFETKPDPSKSVIYISPAIGYNTSDGLMAGAAVHNYGLKYNRFRFFASGLYGVQSKKLNGLADLGYAWRPAGSKHSVRFGTGFARFSTLSGIDSSADRVSAGFIKFAPSIRWILPAHSLLSTTEKWVEWKTYIIGESGFTYHQKSTDQEYYPETSDVRYRYINQLTLGFSDTRVLYPYGATIQVQQARDFFRLNLDARFFFNYASGGGMDIRLFAAKFGYIGNRSGTSTFATARYQPKLTAVRGSEDYTYSNYFIGRNESEGLPSQQMMLRDGGLKIRTDLFQDMQGRSDNWVSSVNLSSAIPFASLPPGFPLRLFFDIGTYAEAWKEDATGTRFLYTGGLQLSLFKNIVNIYAPVVYSKTFRDVLKTVPDENTFLRKVSFTIDLEKAVSKKTGKTIIN